MMFITPFTLKFIPKLSQREFTPMVDFGTQSLSL